MNVNTYGKKEKNPTEFTVWELKMLAVKYNCSMDYLAEDIQL